MRRYLAIFLSLLIATVGFNPTVFAGKPPPPPPHGMNLFATRIDASKPFVPASYAFADLPALAAGDVGALIIHTEGLTTTDCTAGGGANQVLCRWTGAAWTAIDTGAVSDTAFGDGSSWDGVTTIAPSQNAVRDQFYVYDTDGDGDIDSFDGESIGGDITGVGPGGLSAGDAYTDTYLTSGTTMFIWEGTTSNANQVNFVMPEADPSAATTLTYPAETGTFLLGEVAHADNTILTIDGTGSLTQETGVTIDDSENMAGIGTLGVTGVITSADATEASATTTASVKVAGGLGVVMDAWIGDDIVLDSDDTAIIFGDGQDISIVHTNDVGLTVFEGTEEILVLKDGGAGSATNEITILSAATTDSPTIQQTGEDDIGIDFETVNDEEMLQLDAVAAGTNNLKIANAADGVSPALTAVGSSDANVGIIIDAKVAGEIAIGSIDAKFSVESDAIDISNTGVITDAGAITSTGAVTGTSITDGTITLVGDGTVTGLAEGGLNDSTIVAGDIKDGTITEDDLTAAFAFDDGDYLDMSGVIHTANTAEGLVLPTWADVAVVSNVKGGTIAFDEASDSIKFKTADGWESIAATAAPVDAQYLVVADDGSLEQDRTVAWGVGLTSGETGSPVTLTIDIDTTEIDATTWSDAANASNIWTFDVSGTSHTMTAGDGLMTFGDAVTVTDTLTINGNITDGTATWNSSTQAISGMATIDTTGNITSGASFIIGAADINQTDLEKLDGITNGTQAADKAVVADSNINTGISKITELHIGTSGSETQVTSTAAELNILDDVTADKDELNYLDITTLGTGQNSKAVTLTAAGNFTAPAGTWDMSNVTGITLAADEIVDADVVNALTITATGASTWDIATSITTSSIYSSGIGTGTSLDESAAADDSGAYIVGVYTTGFTYSSATNVQTVLSDLDSSIAAAQNTDYDDIDDPGASGEISFNAAESGTYTSSEDDWVGLFITNTQTTITSASELLTLSFTDPAGSAAGQLDFLLMKANNVTLFEADETGLQIGNGTPTNTLDGGDLYITDDLEVDGTATIGVLALAGTAEPTWTWNDSDAAGDEEAMQIVADMTTTLDQDEIADWWITSMHDDTGEDNAAPYTTVFYDGSTWSLSLGAMADGAKTNQAGYESLEIDFNTATDNQITVASNSGATELDFQIATVIFDAVTATGVISGKLPTVVEATATTWNVTTAQARAGTAFINTNAGTKTFVLPAAEAGMSVCIKNGQGVTQILRFDTDGTDYIVMSTGARTSAAGDYYGATSSNSNQACVVAYDATDWYILSEVGTWTEE